MTALLLAAIFLLLLIAYTVRIGLVLAKALLVFSALSVLVLLAPLVAILRSRPG